MIYTITSALIVLAVAGAALYIVDRGYPNTVDALAYWLHRHAKRVRKSHTDEATRINEAWVRELEG